MWWFLVPIAVIGVGTFMADTGSSREFAAKHPKYICRLVFWVGLLVAFGAFASLIYVVRQMPEPPANVAPATTSPRELVVVQVGEMPGYAVEVTCVGTTAIYLTKTDPPFAAVGNDPICATGNPVLPKAVKP